MRREKMTVFRKLLLSKIFTALAVGFLFLTSLSQAQSIPTCGSYFKNFNKPLVTSITTFLDENQGGVLHHKSEGRRSSQIIEAPSARSRGMQPRSLQPRDTFQTRSLSRGATRGGFTPELSPALEWAAEKSRLHISSAENSEKREIQHFIMQARAEFGIRSEGPNSTAVLDGDLNDIAANYAGRKGEFLVLRQNGKIVGTAALFQLDRQTAELRKIYLADSLRGSGLGQALVDHLVRKAVELDYATLELETYSVMQKAIALYTRNGFQRFFPERIANEEGVEAYRRHLKTPKPVLEESEIQRDYRISFEDAQQNPFLKSIYENPERNGRFKYEVFEPFLKKEMQANSAVYEIYLELGIVYRNGRFVIPPVHDMIKNYIQALKHRGIPESHWILPSATYRRETAPGVFEYRTIIPYLEAFPSEPGFRLIEKVPDPVFEYALRNGAMPLANFHDIHHFVVLLSSPDFMIQIKTAFMKLGDAPFTLGQRRRYTYALESLSLVGREQRATVDEILTPVLLDSSTLSDVKNRVNLMSLRQLVHLANNIQNRLDSLFSHFSGVGMSATETALELIDYKNTTTAQDLIRSLDVPEIFNPHIEQNLPRNSFLEDPIYMTTKLGLLLETLKRNPQNFAAERALRSLVQSAAIFMIISSRQISAEKWVQDMMNINFSKNNETMKFIRDVFGENSITYRMLAVP